VRECERSDWLVTRRMTTSRCKALVAAASRLGTSTGADKTDEFGSSSDPSKLRVQFKRLRNKKKDPSRRRVQPALRKAKAPRAKGVAVGEMLTAQEPKMKRGSSFTAEAKAVLLKLLQSFREAGVLQRAISLPGWTHSAQPRGGGGAMLCQGGQTQHAERPCASCHRRCLSGVSLKQPDASGGRARDRNHGRTRYRAGRCVRAEMSRACVVCCTVVSCRPMLCARG
jgi:hypothetical protein